tara:strand:+ start:234 stop:1565 length:1332 start_codon:yes stop_codon:yes gene_type:complete
MNLYILGEESPSHEILTVISWYSKEPINVKLSDVSYNILSINNNLFFEVVGSGISQYDKIYYAMVSSTGNSFTDYMIFEGENPPEENSKPLAAIEATKNLGKESGNMSDQRAPKMIALKEKYGHELRCGYLVNNYNTITKTIDSFSHTHDCAFAAMNAIGVEVVVAQYGSSEYEEYQVPFKYDCIENVVVAENNKSKRSGVPSRVFQKGDNEFEIQVNLYKPYGTHDPGEGYLASRAYVVRKLQPNAVITVTNHGRNEGYFNRKNNKLINLLKFVGVNVDMGDSSITIEREDGVYNKDYWEYTKTGEKNSSIVLEQLFIQKGLEINFTNHAGCGKSYIEINGEFFQAEKTKGIPDIVAFDRENNILLVIEGETSKNYSKGIKQVLDPAFDTFVQKEFVSRIGNDVKVKKYLCTFGKYNNEPEVLFNLTENYEMNYNENAVEVK